jgi:hypothetical protein
MTLDRLHAAISTRLADRCMFGQCRISLHEDSDRGRFGHSIVHSPWLQQAMRSLPAPFEEIIRRH